MFLGTLTTQVKLNHCFLTASESAEDAKEQAKKLVKSGVSKLMVTLFYILLFII